MLGWIFPQKIEAKPPNYILIASIELYTQIWWISIVQYFLCTQLNDGFEPPILGYRSFSWRDNTVMACLEWSITHFCSLHCWPFVGRASNWESNKLRCYITMYSPIARSVVLRWKNWTIIELLGNVFIHNAARLRLSPQMAKPCKEQIVLPCSDWALCVIEAWKYNMCCTSMIDWRNHLMSLF